MFKLSIMTLKASLIKSSYRFILVLFLFSFKNTIAFEKNNTSKNEFSKNELKTLTEENNFKNHYLLGFGDGINIVFYGLDFYSGLYVIDPDGFIDLPEIGSFYAQNLTIQELKEKLTEKFRDYIINPDLKINLVVFRPITVYISGDVRNPGVYTFKSNKSEIPTKNKDGLMSFENNLINNYNIKLYDALKLAKGVNNSADLTNIKVIRKNSQSNGGGKITAKIDLLSSLSKGDLSQNIRLYDGDVLIIPKSKNIIKEQLLAINSLNLNPDKIKVFITGNVVESGEFILDKGTSLTQAIASTGGKKLLSGNIEFLRFNDDGSIEKYKFAYNDEAPINTKNNPILMNGDIIDVKRTLLGKTTEVLKEVSNPILSGYGLYNIFN